MLIHRNLKYSRRQWDGLIKAWKLQIHSWNAKGDTDVFQKIDEWQNKEEDDPILGGPSKEKYSTKGRLISKCLFGVISLFLLLLSFTFLTSTHYGPEISTHYDSLL